MSNAHLTIVQYMYILLDTKCDHQQWAISLTVDQPCHLGHHRCYQVVLQTADQPLSFTMHLPNGLCAVAKTTQCTMG